MTQEKYVILSLELHMFFGRIMMEHAMFLEARTMPESSELIKPAVWYRRQFENVLYNAVVLGDGIISEAAASSGEMITPYTLASEQRTDYFTNIGTNQDLTKMQAKLRGSKTPNITPELIAQVKQLNSSVDPLIRGLIELKHEVLTELQMCRVFIAEYPIFVRNMLSEASDYSQRLTTLEKDADYHEDVLVLWKQGMMEHVVCYRNMLDPSETELLAIIDGFAHRYTDLMRKTRMIDDVMAMHSLSAALKEMMDYRDFVESLVGKIVACEVMSAMFPQMVDHSLREVNYFTRLLRQQYEMAILHHSGKTAE